MDVRARLAAGRLYLDGGCGALLQQRGLPAGCPPEQWNIARPEEIIRLHEEYLRAGADLIETNTFGANRLRFPDTLEAVVAGALSCARQAVAAYGGERGIALSLGPCGRLLRPLGDVDFEEAVSLFAQVVKLARSSVDVILIETMNDVAETKAAVLAAKENCDLPVFVTCAYDNSGQLTTGGDPLTLIALLEGLGVDALGMNCSFGPAQMLELLPTFARYASLPLVVSPNAGLPRSENGRTVYDLGPQEFADWMVKIAQGGGRVLGGCCGTTPAHIAALRQATENISPQPLTEKPDTLLSSYSRAVLLGNKPLLIGERINPTGKARFKQALREHDIAYLLNEAVRQQEMGVDMLDVNVGLPEIDEPALLSEVVDELQAVSNLPLQLDTADPLAMERALRRYRGKALLNSVNGKESSLEAMLPLARKYGGALIALTLDEAGIPDSAAGRVAVAEKILRRAADFGVAAKNIVVDGLTLTVSADSQAGRVTLDTVAELHRLGLRTSLGVSNVSFGLPERERLNAAFFLLALNQGLDAAIMNPYSGPMLDVYHSFLALTGQDENCGGYIAYAAAHPSLKPSAKPEQPTRQPDTAAAPTEKGLRYAIVHGLREQAGEQAQAALATMEPLRVIDEEIVPALDQVGQGFEAKTVFLPQLLMSAEAANAAFSQVRAALPEGADNGHKIVLATVQGDIHDIGKNIVRALLQNYGYPVLDLGRDVAPERVLEQVLAQHIQLVGLSALMTTTVPAMAATIALLRQQAPWCKVVVGGAVLTPEYAAQISADKYAKDAMETVRYAAQVFGS